MLTVPDDRVGLDGLDARVDAKYFPGLPPPHPSHRGRDGINPQRSRMPDAYRRHFARRALDGLGVRCKSGEFATRCARG